MPPKRHHTSFSPIDTLDRNISEGKTYGSNKKPRYDLGLHRKPRYEHKPERHTASQSQGRIDSLNEAIDITDEPKRTKNNEQQASPTLNAKRKRENMTTNGTQEYSRQTASITSIGNFHRKGEKITPLGSKNEYATIESMMKPASRHKKRRKLSDVNGNDANSLTSTPPMSDVANSYNHSYEPDGSPPEEERYSISTRANQRTRRPSNAVAASMAPNRFLNSSEDIQDPDMDVEQVTPLLREPRNLLNEKTLRNAFKRDVSSFDDDVDELQQDRPTVTSTKRANPLPVRPFGGKDRISKVERAIGDIPPTQFYSSEPTRRRAAVTGRNSAASRSDTMSKVKSTYVAKGLLTALPLRSFHDLERSLKGDELKLARDRINAGYIVYLDGKKQAEIYDKHLRTVHIGENMLRFRLLGSMIDGTSQIEYHLEFENAEEGGVFRRELDLLPSNFVQRLTKPEEKLAKILDRFFVKRREIQEQQSRILAEKLAMEQQLSHDSPHQIKELQNRTQASLPRSLKDDSPGRRNSHPLDVSSPVSTTRKNPLRKENGASSNLQLLEESSNNFETRTTRSRQLTSGQSPNLRKSSEAAAENNENLVKYSVATGLGKPWKKPLVFPRHGPNKTTVEFADLPRLDDGEFLNDNLISFWLRYSQKCHSELEKEVYFFNTFFYSSLTKAVKGKKGINYDLVKRWTSKVDLFNYDYVVVPINENVHWYVAIICNLRNIGRSLDGGDDSEDSTHPDEPSEPLSESFDIDDEENAFQNAGTGEGLAEKTSQLTIDAGDPPAVDLIEDASQAVATPMSRKSKKKRTVPLRKLDPDAPVIITLDSFGFGHSPVVKNLKDYLREEGKSKRSMDATINQNGVTAKGIPQQQNYYDCGLYVLFYLARFLQGPRNFITKILSRELSLEKDWPKLSSSEIRAAMRRTIQSEYQNQMDKSSDTESSPSKDLHSLQDTSVMDILTGNQTNKRTNTAAPIAELSESAQTDVKSSLLRGAYDKSVIATSNSLILSSSSANQPPRPIQVEEDSIDAMIQSLDSQEALQHIRISPDAVFLSQVAAAAESALSPDPSEAGRLHKLGHHTTRRRSISPMDLERDGLEARPPTRGKV